jgi:pyruvate formate lyase activating enzyme
MCAGGICLIGKTGFAGGRLSGYDAPGRFSKLAMFQTESPKGIRCLVCPNECNIKEGDTGDCRNRKNFSGKLYSIAYGNPCAVHVDPIEKKPLLHFKPGSYAFSIATAGCNLACLNCQNWTISQTSPSETRNEDLMPAEVVKEAIRNNCKSIAYTYSEPVTFYEYTYDSSKIARSRGISNILVSAGYIHEEPLREIARYIDGANIDLKSFSNDIYIKLNGGTLEPVLNTLKTLNQMNVWLEITNLVIPGWTDDFNMIKRMCDWLHANGFEDNPLHFSRFHPQYRLTQVPATPVATLVKAREIALRSGIKFVYIGNVSGTDAENTWCPTCKKMIVERKGYRILQNSIVSGKCQYCGTPIPGRWQ